MYGDDGTTHGHCPTCATTRRLLLLASQNIGILLMAMCDHCDTEFVHTHTDTAADLRECRRGY
ncbi:hypothetical protein [Nonomuraea sp. NPDC049646]|uniref:hypothetical protein n=1 Tax=unclassified Nonomuraea TaxID=2593643 RepID=UPI0037B44980